MFPLCILQIQGAKVLQKIDFRNEKQIYFHSRQKDFSPFRKYLPTILANFLEIFIITPDDIFLIHGNTKITHDDTRKFTCQNYSLRRIRSLIVNAIC